MVDNIETKVREHYLIGDNIIRIRDWIEKANYLSELDLENLEKHRKIKNWDEHKWQPFPDAGEYQDTGLTSELSNESCSAIWLKLNPGEGFDPHQHYNAIHTMVVYEGTPKVFWQYINDNKVYCTAMKIGDKPYVITPSEKHAVINDNDTRAIILVFNTPAEDLHRHDYAVPIHEHNH